MEGGDKKINLRGCKLTLKLKENQRVLTCTQLQGEKNQNAIISIFFDTAQ